jgi:hypothetical protein
LRFFAISIIFTDGQSPRYCHRPSSRTRATPRRRDRSRSPEPIVGLDSQRLYRHTSRSEALILFIAPHFRLLGIIDAVLFANSVSDVVPFAKQHLQVQG